MDLVDPAGTLQSGTLPTLNIEGGDEGDVQYGLCFLVNYNEDGIYLDSFLDVSSAIGKTWIGVLAAEKLTGIRDREARSLTAAMATLSLRARFASTGSSGPHLVKTSFPLSRSDLEQYLRALDKPALKTFLQRSKV